MSIKDYSESLVAISRLQRGLYEALQAGDVELAVKLADDIIVAAREIRAWILYRKET